MSDKNLPQTGAQQQREAAKKADEQKDNSKELRGPLQTERGVTTMEDTVVAKVAGIAAREVPGVYDMGNAARRAFSAVTDRIPNSKTNVTGGINVEKGDTQTAIDATVVIEYGASVVEVGDNIRENIIDQVESATGLEVIEVNVNVVDVHLPEEDNDDDSSRKNNELQ